MMERFGPHSRQEGIVMANLYVLRGAGLYLNDLP